MAVEISAGSSRFEADVFVARLSVEGIAARGVSDEAGGVEPALGYSGGYRVLVPSETADRARAIQSEGRDETREKAASRSVGLRSAAWVVGVFIVGALAAGVVAGIFGISRGADGPTAGVCPDRPTGPIQLSCPR
jgi:hypothetical protein